MPSTQHPAPSDQTVPPLPGVPAPATLTRICGEVAPGDESGGADALLRALQQAMPDRPLRHVLSRGGWHRLGGVVDAAHQRVAGNILHWAEEVSEGDVERLLADYQEADYFATRLAGKTHFFTAACSDAPDDFIQIEVEELQEQIDRRLIDPDWFPDSIEELIDPLDYPREEPVAVASPVYQFRRITHIGHLLAGSGGGRQKSNLRRFLSDWSASRAGEKRFCDHWVLALREYRDQEGEHRHTARPVSVFESALPDLPEAEAGGLELANAIDAYDRQLGYPFAWYFMMLAEKAANYALAEAVLGDQQEAYSYLATRDLQVLQEWEKRPYSV